MRSRLFLAVALVVSAFGSPTAGRASLAAVSRTPVEFTVTNPVNGDVLTVKGGLYRTAAESGCAGTVMLAVHGLSYGEWGWAFPLDPDTYSVAHALARAGYPTISIDLPGYGESSKPDGQSLTVESYAAMVGQIVSALRQTYGHVGLMGHSAGTEITELAIGLGLAKADVFVPTAYTHVPSERIAQDFFTGDYLRSATNDYEFFGTDHAGVAGDQGRAEYMYAPLPSDNVDPAVVAEDNELSGFEHNGERVNTPSGEIYSIGPQPSKLLMANITAPTLLVLADLDLLFPVDYASEELALFGATDKTLLRVPGAGHSFMLHKNAPATMGEIEDWLAGRGASFPAC